MDPSIMKLLEEDEDETMHSGADVEAFTAALNRDIEGDTSTSQPSDSDSVALSQGSNHTSSQLFPQWQTSSQDENANFQNRQDLNGSQQQDPHSSEMELKQHGVGPESQQQQIDTSQELKQPQDDRQQRQLEQNPFHFSQTLGVQSSEKNPVHNLEPDRTHNPESESHNPKLQNMNNQQAMTTEQATNPMNRGKQVPFAMLLPVLQPQLDKDRAMQLHTLYYKLKKNEISKDGFVRHMRGIVGDQMLKMAVYKLQAQAARNSQTGPNQFSLQSQASAQQHHLKMPPVGAQQGMAPQSFAQLHRKGVTSPADPSHISSSAAQLKTDSSNAATDNNGKKSQEMERHLDSHGMPASQMSSSSLSNINQERERSTIPIQGLSKQQQQHLHFSQSSFPIYGSTGGNYGHPFSGTNVNSSAASLKQQPHDSQMRQGPVHQSIGATQLGTSTQVMNVLNVPNFERQNPFSEPKRVQGGTLTHLTNNSTLQQNSVQWQSSTSKEQKNGALSSMTHVKQEPVDQGNEQQHKSQLSSPQGLSSFSPLQVERGNAITGTLEDETLEAQPSRMSITAQLGLDPNISLRSQISAATPPVGPGNNVKTPPKKPSIGQKKPLESLGSSPPLSSKKQKLSGAFLDQSIEQLNDVTAVSGVNLREEEEQLFSGPKEDSRVSDASRRVVQEEEERLILQKIPLQKKLAEIMSKCGLKSMSNDVERCLSLCVEERMRGLICNLIRLSKQRVNIEKPRHRTLITSCLVYELIPNGSVESHLHGIDKETAQLDWGERLKIALGAARGLAYLHEDSSPRVIHRDFKSSNILLEYDFTPKVSDFGLARTAMDEENRHISTRVMGTFGYVAPEYAMTGHLLVKSDVYSYGVVLLELLTGKKPVDMSQPPGQENLVTWARPLLTSKEGLESIIDPSLGPDFPFDSIAKVAAIASMSVQPEVSHRPFMGEVVQALKLVCNECDVTRELGSGSCSQENISIDMDGRISTNSGQLRDPLKTQSPVSDYDSGFDLERGLSMSDLLSASARLGMRDYRSFMSHSTSGPLRTGKGKRLWQKMRRLAGGSVSEHGATFRLWPGSH